MNLFGVSHIAFKDEMDEQLQEFVDGKNIDAIFLERRKHDATPLEKLKAFLLNPAIMSWKWLYRYLGRVLVLVKNLFLRRELNWRADDERIAEEMSDAQNIPLYRVDKSVEKSILDEGWVWTIWSWVIFTMLIYQVYSFYTTYPGNISLISSGIGLFYLVGTLIFTVSVFIALPFIFGEIDSRNIYMLENILETSKRNSYSEILMITGSKHVEGFERLATLGELETDSEKYEAATLRSRAVKLLNIL